MTIPKATLERDLERLIDLTDLAAVIDALADVAGAKAEHIATNWQDTSSAKVWDHAARDLAWLAAQCERWSI
jgi:hypothetical protein